MTDFAAWFRSITGEDPFPYQIQLATQPGLPSFLDAPTGVGKTAAIVLGWLWRRCFAETTIRQQTPRRLVYCLPMRTLVEQTHSEIGKWLNRAQPESVVGLHLLMGGSVSDDWDIHPEQNCILVGTQDQLLSRALNRGYSMSRYRWPIHFALLNNDCLWVMDETQLMGAGLQTTAQLQGFREQLRVYGPTDSVWMSATLDRSLLQTVNHHPSLDDVLTLSDTDLDSALKPRLTAQKPLRKAQTAWMGDKKPNAYAKLLAAEVTEAHRPEQLTLIICNRVDRAQAIYQALGQSTIPKRLIHGRFRPLERQRQQSNLQSFRGIVVATQAIEAGVDLDAAMMFSELAPWSSLVQRFGRCNRRGKQNQSAQVYWIDTPDLNKKGIALPYDADSLDAARSLLISLDDVGYHSLETLRQADKIPKEEPTGLIPRHHDLLQLFDTSTDLAGHDIDVSPFIREAEDTDVSLAWRSWQGNKPSDEMPALHQEELCRVHIGRARDLISKLSKQTPKQWAWIWDGLQGTWVEARSIYPGVTLLLHNSAGGYSEDLGFTGNMKDRLSEVPLCEQSDRLDEQLDADNRDPLTPIGQYIALRQHADDVAAAVRSLCEALADYSFNCDRPDLVELLERSGRWHDAGKAHAVFQEMLTRDRPDSETGGPWAKSDRRTSMVQERRGFRHELVSALVALQQGEAFLLAYLIACHHGKVRMTIQPRPTETPPKDDANKRYALGVWEGDEVPAIDLGTGVVTEAHTLSLACMEMGGTVEALSWTEQAIALLEEFGPFKLAFLESLIRIADWQVSKQYYEIALAKEVTDA